jgi:hypothetical protein
LKRRKTRLDGKPDNRWVVTGSLDKTARLWLLQMKDLLDLARTTVGRNFFADEWQLYFPGEFCALFFNNWPISPNAVQPLQLSCDCWHARACGRSLLEFSAFKVGRRSNS